MISPGLKLKVQFHLLSQVFRTNHLLQEIIQLQPVKQRSVKRDGSDIISLFMRRFNLQLNNPDDLIIKQGDKTTDIYFMVNGEATVSIENTVRQPLYHFKELATGDHFGEISAIYGCPRSATITAMDYCTFAVLS